MLRVISVGRHQFIRSLQSEITDDSAAELGIRLSWMPLAVRCGDLAERGEREAMTR